MKNIQILILIIGSFTVFCCKCPTPDNPQSTPKDTTGEKPIEIAPPVAIDSTYYKMSDSVLLDRVQRQTFKYFWDFAEPNSGMARERNTSGDLVTSGGSGFGVMVILVGIERRYITRQQGLDRLLKITKFLRDDAKRYHGAWAHWINGKTGETRPFSQKDDGGDIVETSFMIQGLLTVREYFDGTDAQETELRQIITTLWEEVEWDWYTQGGQDILTWHWSETYGFEKNHRFSGWNETLITYLLAIASPTHPVKASLYKTGWAKTNYDKEVNLKYGYRGGPLFFTHYSFLGLDPHFTDSYLTEYDDYFARNSKQTLLNRRWCIDRQYTYDYYNENCWGLTASDTYNGYKAHEPTQNGDNGTITPTAAISSIPYTPEESLAFIRYLFTHYGDKMWGSYGFKDAFNVEENWYASSYLAIDQGPIIIMIENYRTGLLWDLFMQNDEITSAFTKIGLTKTN